jgi:cytosine deaminase
MLDLIIRQAQIAGKSHLCDISCLDGFIVEVTPQINDHARVEIDAAGHFVTPPFIDSHFHMDATLSILGEAHQNESGTLLEGIEIWGQLRPEQTIEKIKKRAHKLLKWSIARGTLAIRSHVDVCDPELTAVQALLEVKEEIKPYVDLQLVAFPQDGYLRDPRAKENMVRALDMGVDVIGGIPHFERTMSQGEESVKLLCELAAKRGLMVDLHCDESDDPHSRHIETLAAETIRYGLQGRVTGSHLTSMHSMDNYYVSKLLPLMKEAELNAICNPLVNLVLQGRHDTYPKRRGLTRVKEMLATGINVALGHDDVLDPWYPLGTHDMLEVAHMALHALHMSGRRDMEELFKGVTYNPAKILGLDDYGLEPGCRADVVVLQARNPVDALRLKAARLKVVRGGKIIAETPELKSQVYFGSNLIEVDFS